MTRSEKEIRERIKELKEKDRPHNYFQKGVIEDEFVYEVPVQVLAMERAEELDWVLEGEPRYSVKELKKIFEFLNNTEKTSFAEYKDYFYGEPIEYPLRFIEFLKKNPGKVKEILEEK